MSATPNDPSPLPSVEGGCLCGAVRYRARPENREGYYCHCRMCQLALGNTRAAFFNLRKDAVEWTHGEPARHASSKIARRGFCNQCGTPLTFEYNDSERMDLTIGSLDDPAAFKPTSHFAVETRIASWHVEDGLPGERFDASERLMARWKKAYGDDVQPGLAAAQQS
jgi:hypothetical protein